MKIFACDKIWCSSIPQRYVIALLCFFGLFNAYAMRSCLSIAITEMVRSSGAVAEIEDDTCTYDDNSIFGNGSIDYVRVSYKNTTKEKYNWSEYTQGIILSSFYWSYIISHIPGSYMADKYGGKNTFGIGMLITAILTILTPTAVYIGESTALIALRILMGLGEGVTYPAVNSILSKWVPPEERSRSASFVHSSVMIGTVFATIVSGWILQYSSVGWPLVFYVMGIIGFLWNIVWQFFCYSSPRDHPFITEKEANYLKESMKEHTHEKPPPVPWRHILASKSLWATIIAMTGGSWMHNSIVIDLPKYMNGVLKFSVELNGYFTSLVYTCTWIGAMITPWLADYLIAKKNVSITLVRKIGVVFALPVTAGFIIGASHAGCDRVLVIAILAVAMACKSFNYLSIASNLLDLSPNYAGAVIALANGVSSLTGIGAPYVIGVFTPNQTPAEWRLVFWIIFAITCFSAIVFLIFGSGEVEYWNDPEFVQAEIDKKRERKIERTDIYSHNL